MAQTAPDQYLIVRKGQLPIVIAAPHGGRTPLPGVKTRQGGGLAKFVTTRDERTMELAEKVAAAIERKLGLAPFVVIALFERKHVDANRAEQDAYDAPGASGAKLVYDAYHRALTEACADVLRTWGRGVLLDIHGQAADKEAVFRGTNNGLSVTHLVKRFGEPALRGPKSIFGMLAAQGYPVIPAIGSDAREDPRFGGGYTVRTYGSGGGGTIDAIQLEYGARWRATESLDKTATDLAEAVAVFAKEYLPPATPRRN